MSTDGRAESGATTSSSSLPNAVGAGWESFQALCGDKRLAVFLDYDGTLSCIVSDPDKAYMTDAMRRAVSRVARRCPTAIISGRGREKVCDFVKLDELYYAGSHGLDIQGPKSADASEPPVELRPAADFVDVLDSVCATFRDRLSGVAGAGVEHNKYCLSVHYRNVDPAHWDSVKEIVEAVVAEHAKELRLSAGRKVLEIKPAIDWHKGKAVGFLLNALGFDDDCADVLPIYLGDDTTDEDAFRQLRGRPGGGVGVLVSSVDKPTAATFALSDPSEVETFLGLLATLCEAKVGKETAKRRE